MLLCMRNSLRKFTCIPHLVFIVKWSKLYVDSINLYMASSKPLEVSLISFLLQSKMLVSNNQGHTILYSLRFMVILSLLYYYMLTR